MLVSIILPVYNAEQLLSKCIDSVLNQSFQDYELLLVNDGSKDDSESICRRYADRDARVKYLTKPNGGASDARNYGLKHASAAYVAFIDSDDYAEPEWLQSMVDEIQGVDLVIQGHYRIDKGVEKVRRLTKECITRSQYRNACDRLLHQTSLGYIWSMLFKNSIIKDKQILFNTSMKLQEDLDFVLRYLVHTQSIMTIDSVSYHYNYVDKKYSYTPSVAENILSDMKEIIDGESMVYWRRYYETEILFSFLRCLDRQAFAGVQNYVNKEDEAPNGLMSKIVKSVVMNFSYPFATALLTPLKIIHNYKNR